MRVLFDTSVVIPLILDTSLSRRLADRLQSSGHEIAVSPSILIETQRKLLTSASLRKWLRVDDDLVRAFLYRLPSMFLVAPGLLEVQGAVEADADDDHILAAALEISADFVVSEDRHLLDLGAWRGILIVNRAAMLQALDRPADDSINHTGERT